MATSYTKGLAAEDVAVSFLHQKGFSILDRRFRSACGEVDIVAEKGNRLSFVEVKQRRSHAECAYAITQRQQQRICSAAEIWLQGNPAYDDREMTFDAILISPGKPPYHMQDAFRI
jgi:putative endonuclease